MEKLKSRRCCIHAASMAIEKFVRLTDFPVSSQPAININAIVERFVLITFRSTISCARAFLSNNTSNSSKLARFIELMNDLTEFKSDDPQQVARASAVIASMRGPMYSVILIRLILIATFRQLEIICASEIISDMIYMLREQTRQDADELIIRTEMTKKLCDPPRKRPRQN